MHLREPSLAVLLAVSASGLLGATTCQPRGAASGRTAHPATSVPEGIRSNITRDDYAGSAACEPCHADIYAAWQGSAMHQMTRPIQGARVLAPFDGTVFRFKEDSARLDQAQGERRMTITSARYGNKTYRVTKVIGGHYREDFAGVEVNAQGSPSTGEEVVLPVSYVFKQKTLRYKGYSVMLPERDGLRAGPVWQRTCILCHNTAPYLTSILGALAGPGARGYQGEVVDPLLPPEKRWSFAITDDDAFRRALGSEIDFLHGYRTGHAYDPRSPQDPRPAQAPRPPHDPSAESDEPPEKAAARAVAATREHFGERHLIEVGVGCESCHGGSKEHVADPRVHPSFEPRAPFLRVATPRNPEHAAAPRNPEHVATARDSEKQRGERINRTCARCHQVLFSGYPRTWEGGSRSRSQGGSNINSGEARDMLLGRCQASCVPCHDPHARESGGRTRHLDATADGNAMCTSCHTTLRTRESVHAHTRHDPDGAGGRCMGCHMPRKNLSLDGALTRYHRIGSPTDPVKVERDRPLECALCHTDKSVGAVLSDMQRLFGKRYDESRLRALYPDWTQNALLATLESGKPHEQAVAMQLLGEARNRSAAARIAQQMVHPIPLVRGYAERALESIVGSSSPVDLHRDDAQIEAATRAWLSATLR
ncbi:multiheme c-type cytochrome [Pendulispora albinea]|uniref:Cytochrome c3 family protein n=1 Tax=Pendulispora albinea TaxID=2741071 RepID=A0ABZ2M015_9BACT